MNYNVDLTVQYNPRANNQGIPYDGVRLNYTLFVDGFPGGAQDVKYDDGFGTEFGLGVVCFLDDRRFFNTDIRNTHFNY